MSIGSVTMLFLWNLAVLMKIRQTARSIIFGVI
jgi:hypothetical protein